MNTFLLVFLVASLILLSMVYRKIPDKKIFLLFGMVLISIGIIIFYSGTDTAKPEDNLQAQRQHAISLQQEAFSRWFAGYQRLIDSLDYNWRTYNTILTDFRNDSISLETCYVRLGNLEKEVASQRDIILKMMPPEELDEKNSALTHELIKKTLAYSEEQLMTIRLTQAAADPEAQLTNSQSEQSRHLDTIMAINAPAGLFTADEITSLRHNLSAREDR